MAHCVTLERLSYDVVATFKITFKFYIVVIYIYLFFHIKITK